MSTEDPLASAKGIVGIVQGVIQAAGDDPQVKEAGHQLGKSALTLTKTINNALLPLAAVNYAFDKAREYFSKSFVDEIKEKLIDIPNECLTEPKPSIAGPALQGLAFALDEPELKLLFLNLIASSMDGRQPNKVHPAFVDVIRQITAPEASNLLVLLKLRSIIPIVSFSLKQDVGEIPIAKHVMNWSKVGTSEPLQIADITASVDNFIRLGLVEVDYLTALSDKTNYEWVKDRPEYLQAVKEYANHEGEVKVKNGILSVTAFGRNFYGSVK